MNYAAQIGDGNVVVQVIVGTAAWATEFLGGLWVDCPPCGPGWRYVDGEFIPPPADSEPVDSFDDA